MKVPIFRIVFFLCLLDTFNSQFAYGQRVNDFMLPAWSDVSKMPWRQSIYRFQEFQKGKITYTKGFKPDHEFDLNYNVYFERMDFIDKSGDTLGITNTSEIESIQIGNKTFFHDKNSGYYEVLVSTPVALAVRNQFVLEELKFSNGAKFRGTPTDVRGSAVGYARVYRKAYSYFFIDQNNKVYETFRASVLKLFPSHSTDIKGYILEHHVDFDSRQHLMDLTNYCNQLNDSSQDASNSLNTRVTLRLPAGKRYPSKTVMDSLYHFPEFQEAKVIWIDQSSSFHPERMNYNTFTGRMDVVDEKGDTTRFARWHQTKIVNLDGDAFFQDLESGYLEILLHGDVSLGVRSKYILVTDKEMLESLGFIDQASALDLSNKAAVTNYDRLYKREKTYFFIHGDEAYESSKYSILKLMRKHNHAIIDYFNESNLSLTDEQQLRALTSYCNKLLTKS